MYNKNYMYIYNKIVQSLYLEISQIWILNLLLLYHNPMSVGKLLEGCDL